MIRVPGTAGLAESLRVRRRDRALRDRRPEALAAAWRDAVGPIAVPGLEPGPTPRRILLLPKVGGTEDVVAALRGRGERGLELVGLPRGEVKAAFRALVGPGHGLLTDLDYRPDDAELEVAKARYRELLVPMVARLRDELRLAAVVAANVAYYAERELAAACERVGLPFLVLHKESIRSPRQREAFTRAYRERTGAFSGRAVAVYNRDERASQVTAGVVADAAVVGCPRVDVLHGLRRERALRGGAAAGPVVLFAVDPAAGTWTPFDAEGTGRAPRWDGLALRTESALLGLARSHPGEEFVIKAKVGHGERLRARLPEGLPSNVRVVTDGTATELLARARLAIAFNSTVVPEALAAGVSVAVPRFEEAAEASAEGWLHPYGAAVTWLADPAELDAVHAGLAGAPVAASLAPPVQHVLDELIGNPDGGAADRTWAWLGRHL